MTRVIGYVEALARANRIAEGCGQAEATWLAFLRAGCRGAFALRAPGDPLVASAEFVALLAVLEELARRCRCERCRAGWGVAA